MKDDSVYLRHILECIRRIEEDGAAGIEAFRASHTLQDAILRNLQVLAESSRRISMWGVTQRDIPELKKAVERILRESVM